MDAVSSSSITPSRRRIIFIDIDGTILEHGAQMSASTPVAIAAARAGGHLVYLCTGRSAGDINPKVRAIPVDGAITNGGAFAVRGDEQIVAHLMPRPLVDRMIAYFEEHGAHYFLQTDGTVYVSPGVLEHARRFVRTHPGRRTRGGRRLGGRRPPQPLPAARRGRPRCRGQGDLPQHGQRHAHPRRRRAGAAVPRDPRFHPAARRLERRDLPAGRQQGRGDHEVLAVLGMDAADAVGIGDSWNDVEMFEVVGTAVAMGGADPELQAMADLVTTGVLEDGVSNALTRLGLI
jgi:hydroxymethylpyrimidine pyrophosphatase-like HAD family hydrolase